LTSFAISKAENSTLTVKEAEGVYDKVLGNEEYEFIGGKLKSKFSLVKKDYEKLEFYNIAKVFKELRASNFGISDLTPEFIKEIHGKITFGMDVFQKYLPDFTLYRSGRWRDNNNTRVGEYVPPPFSEVEGCVHELVSWLKGNLSPISVACFHSALYGLHPFSNGNKRVCRVLEHILLKEAGLNKKNLYSTSYYYHKQKERYYKQLSYSLKRGNWNHFASFILEAVVLSIISVVKTSTEIKRSNFIARQDVSANMKAALKPLIKRRELQFKNLFRAVKGKMARQTFVTALEKTVADNIATRREAGKARIYGLNISLPETDTLDRWLSFAKERLEFIPDDIRLV
jgi:Fic family protein